MQPYLDPTFADMFDELFKANSTSKGPPQRAVTTRSPPQLSRVASSAVQIALKAQSSAIQSTSSTRHAAFERCQLIVSPGGDRCPAGVLVRLLRLHRLDGLAPSNVFRKRIAER